jgi:hypothetical protein
LASPRVPLVRTLLRQGPIEIIEEAFAVVPDSASPTNVSGATAGLPSSVGGTAGQAGSGTGTIRQGQRLLTAPPASRFDIVLVRLRNTGGDSQVVRPLVTIQSQAKPHMLPKSSRAVAGNTRLVCSEPIESAQFGPGKDDNTLLLRLAPATLPAGGEHRFAVTIARGKEAGPGPQTLAEAEAARGRLEPFWNAGRLPYDRIQVPDPGIQALVESSMRNIYQAREIKNGLPAFQVGPTCYRGLWIVDGSFLLEAATYFGCGDEARAGIQYMLSHQRPDGGFTLIQKYWKESGIVLWAVTRHARLTGDKAWLAGVWPKLERAVAFIERLRQEASVDPKAPHYGLIPPGFPDGGLGGELSEYTNIYWTLVGLRAVIQAARWLGKEEQAAGWQRQYDDFYAAFRKAAQRDMRTDPHGNRYLPIVMLNAGNHLPQRAQWAFCHAVFPGQVFAPDDPLVRGNLAMLQATEREGMVFGTGWAADGIWNYFASFYGHAWLWMGEGQKAARVLYAFANHASPLLAWREEQMPRGQGSNKVGDMPHNWASAEFIRLVRHLLVLERGGELHLLEGMPAAWARPGAATRLRDMPTEFGPMLLEVVVTDDGARARVRVTAPSRSRPQRLVLHLGEWAGTDHKAAINLPTTGTTEQMISLPAPAGRRAP